jgi:hypothetical protein
MILSGEAEAGWAVHEFFIRDILQVFDSVAVSMLDGSSIQLKTKHFLSRSFVSNASWKCSIFVFAPERAKARRMAGPFYSIFRISSLNNSTTWLGEKFVGNICCLISRKADSSLFHPSTPRPRAGDPGRSE